MDKFFKTIKKYIKPISVFLLAIIITFALWALAINIRNADKVLDYYDRCTHQLIETTVKTKNYEVHSNFLIHIMNILLYQNIMVIPIHQPLQKKYMNITMKEI